MDGAARSLLVCLPSLVGGGAERACITLANTLVRKGWTVSLMTVHGGGALEATVDPAIARVDLACRRVLLALPRLAALVRRLQPQVVLTTPAHLNLMVLMSRPLLPKGMRLVIREANTPSMTLPLQPLPALFEWLCRQLYPRADAVVCPAQLVADELHERLRVPAHKVHVLRNPVDATRMAPARADPARRPGTGVRLVAAGRLTPQKNFAALLRSLAELPETTTLELFGTGPQEASLQALVRELGLQSRACLHGFSDEVWRWMAGADAVVLPSLWEGMPNVALEALALGTPVVAMRSAGGIAELQPRDPDAIRLAGSAAELTRALGQVQTRDVGKPGGSLLESAHSPDAAAAAFGNIVDLCGAPT